MLRLNTKAAATAITSVLFAVTVLVVSGLAVFEDVGDSDMDQDHVHDAQDNCPKEKNSSQNDFDGDSMGNPCDPDDDNDKIVDQIDMFDRDPDEWADFDFDGIGSKKDTDDDNDGILDMHDRTPQLPTEVLAQKYLNDIQGCSMVEAGTSKLLCYGKLFDSMILEIEDNSQALDLALSLSKIGAIEDCHFISHEIGHSAFEKNPDVISNLAGTDSTICRGGFHHGIMSAYFHDIKESKGNLPEYKTLCNTFIGTSDYQDCIHGLGHGFVHYYLSDLESSIDACHEMSFYQSSLCIGGVMMQYTDEKLTKSASFEEDIPSMCSKTSLSPIDYHQCNVSLGLSLAFYTNHDRNEGTRICSIITDMTGKNTCIAGLNAGIDNMEEYKEDPITREIREKFQPQYVDGGSKIIDIRSPADISDFQFVSGANMMSFSIDRPQYVVLYIPSDLAGSEMVVSVNGEMPRELNIENDYWEMDVVMVSFVPRNPGTAWIAPLA